MTMNPQKVLTIAGSDCSGGAGLQADLKTFQERDVYGMSVVTVLVAMRPENWDHVVHPVDMEMIRTQLATIKPGIDGVAAAKTGMLPTVDIIRLAGEFLASAGIPKIVIDPVMVCKGTKEALFPENTQAMIDYLLPVADVVTPNSFEAAQLAGMDEIRTEEQLCEAARRIHAAGAKNVAIKAPRVFSNDKVADFLFDGTDFTWWWEDKLTTAWTHGAGCSFSACITAELAKGADVRSAFQTAHAFVKAGLEHSFPLNRFVGPIYHKALARFA